MKGRKISFLTILVLVAGMILAACGGDKDETKDQGAGTEEDNFSVAMVTDQGGVDDKSFNQSAWEGFQAYGEKYGLSKGDNGFDYLESKGDADYMPNLNNLVRRNFDLIFGIGFLLQQPIEEIADQQPESNFVIVDSVVEKDNVASILFKEQEAAFLAGVAAAKETKTNKIGFVGGMESDVIDRFENGFIAGVKSVNPDIDVDVQYVGSFTDSNKGKQIANQMYTAGADIIFHAAGGSGNGVFAEAKERKEQNPEANIWVIGVDSDQYEEGQVGDHNVTLTSAMKRVDVAVQDVIEKSKEGNFPGGELLSYGLSEDGVSLATTGDNMSQETLDAVADFEGKIRDGEITPPGNKTELEQFLNQ